MSALRVYWQPGCTSCLAAKQFLASCGFEFESINVREDPRAQQQLARLGARSVPVVARGDEWVYAQERRDLARFLGVATAEVSLAGSELTARIAALLLATEGFAAALPAALCERGIAGRSDRCIIDLPFHIAQIVAGLLDAARGDELSYAHFERRPVGDGRSVDAVLAELRSVHARFSAARAELEAADARRMLRTYYGEQPLLRVLERSAWHVAQHARQLEHLLVANGLQPSSPLGDRELAGLPLPEGVWDAEFGATG